MGTPLQDKLMPLYRAVDTPDDDPTFDPELPGNRGISGSAEIISELDNQDAGWVLFIGYLLVNLGLEDYVAANTDMDMLLLYFKYVRGLGQGDGHVHGYIRYQIHSINIAGIILMLLKVHADDDTCDYDMTNAFFLKAIMAAWGAYFMMPGYYVPLYDASDGASTYHAYAADEVKRFVNMTAPFNDEKETDDLCAKISTCFPYMYTAPAALDAQADTQGDWETGILNNIIFACTHGHLIDYSVPYMPAIDHYYQHYATALSIVDFYRLWKVADDETDRVRLHNMPAGQTRVVSIKFRNGKKYHPIIHNHAVWNGLPANGAYRNNAGTITSAADARTRFRFIMALVVRVMTNFTHLGTGRTDLGIVMEQVEAYDTVLTCNGGGMDGCEMLVSKNPATLIDELHTHFAERNDDTATYMARCKTALSNQ